MKSDRYFLYFISIAIILLFSREGFGYSLLGYYWDYSDIPVPYHINSSGSSDISGDSEMDAIKDSFQTWEDVSCSYLEFTYQGTTSKDSGSWGVYDGVNLIVWEENNWPSYLNGAIAVTAPIVNNSGQFLDVDIMFNGVDHQWSTNGSPSKMDVQNIATHEIGHLVGLDDLYGAWDSAKTMYGYSYEGETQKRTLHQDDIDGICSLYDNGNPPPDVSEGEFGDHCDSGDDCDSGLCVYDGYDESTAMCTECCNPDGYNTCPDGYYCAELADPWEGCEGACWPEEEEEYPKPEIDEIGDKEVYAGQMLTFQVTAHPKRYQYLFTFSVKNLPEGAYFNSGTRTFSWKPKPLQAGIWKDVEFRVENPQGEYDSEKIDITVLLEKRNEEEAGGCSCEYIPLPGEWLMHSLLSLILILPLLIDIGIKTRR